MTGPGTSRVLAVFRYQPRAPTLRVRLSSMTRADHGYLYDLLTRIGLSDFAASTGEFLLVRPLKIVLIIGVAIMIARFGARTFRRFVFSAHRRSPLRVSVRGEQRATTIADALGSMSRILILGVAGLFVLDELGMNLAPLLAGAGIVGVALGFGAQSLVKDFLSGMFILVEDQYGVGDVIDLGEKAIGTVGDVGLRITRLRAVDGSVWFVPNGEIRRVGNSSMEWSRAVIDVVVGYDSDVTKTKEVVAAEAAALCADEVWGAKVLEPPEVWGVEALGSDGLTIRLVVKTAPREQYVVARELRERLNRRLRSEGISGPKQSLVVTSGSLDFPPPPPPADDDS